MKKSPLRKFLGFARSVTTAARAHSFNVPWAVRSVLRARNTYDIGAPFHALYSLANKPESEWKYYIAEARATTELMQINPDYPTAITTDKARFTAHCRRHGIPTIPILCTIDRAPDADTNDLDNVFSLSRWTFLQGQLPNNIFVKLIDGAHGTDAFTANRVGEKWLTGGQTYDQSAFHRFCLEKLGERRGWLFQPIIRPHPALAEIMYQGSLGTLRIVTYLDRGNPQLLLPCLRIPAGGNLTDNFSLGRSGNLVAAVDLETGVLSSARMSKSRTWPQMISTDRHPDTGNIITGRAIPFWREIKEVVKHGQTVTPTPVTIGWDIAVTEEGPLVVEANSLYGTDILQVAYDRGIRSDLQELITAVRATR